jgi:hypothetical protein
MLAGMTTLERFTNYNAKEQYERQMKIIKNPDLTKPKQKKSIVCIEES